MAAPPAARTLQRRMRARQLYRVRRDRKIAVDWLGREFRLTWRKEGEHGVYESESVRLRLDIYDPSVHRVWMQRLVSWGELQGVMVVWDTDEFWSLLRTRKLEQA